MDLAEPDIVRIYDSETGDPVESGVDDADIALAAAFGPDSTVTYVVADRGSETDDGDLHRVSNLRLFELRTCTLAPATAGHHPAGECQTSASSRTSEGFPVPAPSQLTAGRACERTRTHRG